MIEKPKVDEVGESLGSQSKHFLDKFANQNISDEDEENDATETEQEPREELFESEYKIKLFSPNRQTLVVVQAFNIPGQVRLFLEENLEILKRIRRAELPEIEVSKFKSELMTKFKDSNFPQPAKTVDSIMVLGPNGCGSNILLNEVQTYQDRSNFWSTKAENIRQFDHQLLSGFQLATQSGPLCEEPMSGVGIRLLQW